MAPQTFHYFSTLPKADRELIWALAIRSKRPSAHIFTADTDTEPSLFPQYWLHHSEFATNLAAPQVPTSDDDNQERQFSWVKDNRSTYLIDYGLWTACRESRAAMEERFKVTEAPATSYFFSGGEWQRCLTYPKTDLFLLRPLDPGTLGWECTYGFPFYKHSQPLEVPAVHIALSRNLIGWGDGPGAECVIEAVAGGLPYTDKLWLVDYSLRRRADIPPRRNRHRFHGNGCIFTEVRGSDSGWCHDWDSGADKGEDEAQNESEGEDKSEGGAKNKNLYISCFLRNLEMEVTEVLNEREKPSPEYTPFNYTSICNKPVVGILAYEECDF